MESNKLRKQIINVIIPSLSGEEQKSVVKPVKLRIVAASYSATVCATEAMLLPMTRRDKQLLVVSSRLYSYYTTISN